MFLMTSKTLKFLMKIIKQRENNQINDWVKTEIMWNTEMLLISKNIIMYAGMKINS